MRVVTTNDFVGSFFPQPTSYGRLPGGAALCATVAALRGEDGVWIDTGDLAQGSALGALTDGAWAFGALRELPIDVAVVGNHELDWGAAHLRRHGAGLPFLAANLDLGLPAVRRFGALGVIGLSLPAMGEMQPGVEAAPDPVGLVRDLAGGLRGDGARWVVLALHDGVERAGAFAGSVDLVLGGHTLECHARVVGGVPFLQPWAFGSQVGVADLEADGVRLRLVDVGPERPWPEPAQDALEADVVGALTRPLRDAAGGETSLSRAIASGTATAAGERVFVGPGDVWNQPARDGVHAFLPAGPVTRAQVLRLTPFCGGRGAWGGQLVGADAPEAVDRALLAAVGGVVAGHGDALVLTPFHAALVERRLGRDLGWQPVPATLRDGLLAAVAR